MRVFGEPRRGGGGAGARWALVAVGVAVGATLSGPRAAAAQACAALDAKALLDRTDDLFRGSSSRGRMTMKVVTANWSRELKLEAWSKGTKRSLVRILAPLKEQGTATLMVDDGIWNYLPKVRRTIKVPSSMLAGAWMGSHVTNDDLLKETRLADDYAFERTFSGEREGRRVIEITCVPREDVAVVWGKLVIEIDEATCLPVRHRFFGEDLKLARSMVFSDVKTLGGRALPTVIRVLPVDKPEEMTELRYDDLAFDVALGDEVFTLRNLEK